MSIDATLFDADGANKNIEIEKVSPESIKEKQLLWVRIVGRERKTIEETCRKLGLENAPVGSILNVRERPRVDIFENFFRFFINSIKLDESKRETAVPLDFLVGKNFVISISDEKSELFDCFLEREKGERQIGELDAESFVAALLDLQIVSYFRMLEDIEEEVDKFDDKILKTEMEDEDFLKEMVRLRNRVSRLRRFFMPHRDVFYALSRADFQQISESDSAEQFSMLNSHFENAVDAIESSRDTVVSLFELYATKSSQKMNYFIQQLTFITLLFGGMGVVAGILGMNYEVDYIFKSPYGFWITLGGMILISFGLTILARYKRWI
ncbi:MAG TPA: magnesium transporter CorA family protein [Pyrinomonadaceae bacterium]|nr:magnesium transporter CorA family protein [Pyrinomonadaceae bacterium]